jgi:hypothetical protein
MNGLLATVVGWDEAAGRWQVALKEGSGMVKLNASSMEVVTGRTPTSQWQQQQQHSEVGLTSQRLNPSEAPERLQTGTTQQRSSETLVPGQEIQIAWEARPNLHGQRGTLMQWDANDDRWKVCMQDNSVRMLKPAHIRAVGQVPSGRQVQREMLSGAAPPRGQEGSLDVSRISVNSSGMQPSSFDSTAKLSGGSAKLSAGQAVRVVGLIGRPDLNGKKGTTVTYLAEEGRWKVIMDDGTGKVFSANNLEIARAEQGASCALERADPARPELSIGQTVRIMGIKARPELNGKEGTLVEWDASEERWKVRLEDGTGKMLKSSNLVQMDF